MAKPAPLPAMGLAIGALLAGVLVGCGKKSEPSGAPTAATSAAPAAASAAASTSAATLDKGAAGDNGAALKPGETIMGRLQHEAQGRPKLSPTAEEVFAAFKKQGAEIGTLQQSMATTYKADYCVGGYTPGRELAATVCEYDDEASAKAGHDLSKSLFPQMTNRDVWTRKATTLTIVQQNNAPTTPALEKKLVAAFLAL